MKKKINVIIVPQEYNQANHIELWQEMGNQSNNITVVVNIGADLFVSVMKKRFFRIKEAMQAPRLLKNNLILLRPLYILRPEVSNNIINWLNVRLLKRSLKKIVPNIEEYQINVLHYGGVWSSLLDKLHLNINSYYYIMDEVRNDAHNNQVNAKRSMYDEMACKNGEFLYLMSPKLTENREEYLHKLKVVGNGAMQKKYDIDIKPIQNSVGIIGNIRDWIDCDLLEKLIKLRQDIHFGFVGNIENNMQSYMEHLTSTYKNVEYYGEVNKAEIHNWYRKFNAIIVPYKQNEFMKATRPIKIVESIFASTPVVTIPVSGYDECTFIKFAKSMDEFSSKLDIVINNKIDIDSKEYKDFIKFNSWSYKAEEILSEFE
ncbi:glycosyltransferase [Bacillus hominis]|uniref:glycosyltransferase n=1 Tax=Bacillus hominis TaxID=2817478 RepID=UPI0025A01268|nr:glycosyltransferase [Bacillus hominis]MDM5196231.1 glycosyltransferase [Bacillus hominis]